MEFISFISAWDHVANFEDYFLEKNGKMIFHSLSHLMQKKEKKNFSGGRRKCYSHFTDKKTDMSHE